jgi:hypothetical protein
VFLTSALDGVVKGKAVPVRKQLNIMPWRYMEEWRYSYTILDLKPLPICLWEKCPRYPLNTKLGVSQSRRGLCGVEKYLLSLTGVEPRPSSPSLYRLSYIFIDFIFSYLGFISSSSFSDIFRVHLSCFILYFLLFLIYNLLLSTFMSILVKLIYLYMRLNKAGTDTRGNTVYHPISVVQQFLEISFLQIELKGL